MNNEEFINFLKSFQDDYIEVSEISRSHSGNQDILINNSIKMYSLDDICKKSPIVKNNLPKTTDAIYYKLDGDKLTFYIIEFKFFNMDSQNSSYNSLNYIYEKLKDLNYDNLVSDNFLVNFEKVRNNFVDSVEVSLRLKPYETLMVALPLLYEEYSGAKPSEFREFLEDIDVKLYVFINRTAPNRNISAERSYVHSINNALNHQYLRLKQANLITYFAIRASHQFNEFLQREGLV